MTIIDIEMLKGLAAYTGPVIRCKLGKARGEDIAKKEDRAGRWLNAHRTDVVLRDGSAERRRRRMERAKQDRIAKRNAFLRKRNNLSTP